VIRFGAILALSVGLAMDATAVSAARGMAVPRVRPRHALLVAVFFGGFQALMPVIGWLVGSRIGPLVEAWDHWIAFVLLGAIGAKMIWESRDAKGAATQRSEEELFGLRVMLLLAIATSIDALAVGITLPMLEAPFALSVTTIGVTTAVMCVVGLIVGRRAGAMFGRRLDFLGGVILIGVGTMILLEHLRAG
jgi:manganese efflux pump family protein